MDTTALDIMFDREGHCNYCREFFELINRSKLNTAHKEKVLNDIKRNVRNKPYDCLIGVSGGLDSSYALYVVVKKLGLRPLAVHLDNGWNSELSVSNIEKLVKALDVDLYTYVIDWQEFKDLQIAFFRANVIDIEILTDHALAAILYKVAYDRQLRHIVAGTNIANEGMRIPPGWNHSKMDLENIRAIYRKFGSGKKLRTFPKMGVAKYLKYRYINKIKWIPILDYVPYIKDEAMQILNKEIGWRYYEKKHYESVFTRFYQGYILPIKFNIDKRRLHYATLICSGQLSRDRALELMRNKPYDEPSLLEEDKNYVLKKLGFSHEEFEKYLNSPEIPHNNYPSEEWIYNMLLRIQKIIKLGLKISDKV
jgi:N-acetyl sugar amidotransferase